jgi:hypothetical protein
MHVAYLLSEFATTILIVLYVWRTMLEWFLIATEEEWTDLRLQTYQPVRKMSFGQLCHAAKCCAVG